MSPTPMGHGPMGRPRAHKRKKCFRLQQQKASRIGNGKIGKSEPRLPREGLSWPKSESARQTTFEKKIKHFGKNICFGRKQIILPIFFSFFSNVVFRADSDFGHDSPSRGNLGSDFLIFRFSDFLCKSLLTMSRKSTSAVNFQ